MPLYFVIPQRIASNQKKSMKLTKPVKKKGSPQFSKFSTNCREFKGGGGAIPTHFTFSNFSGSAEKVSQNVEIKS